MIKRLLVNWRVCEDAEAQTVSLEVNGGRLFFSMKKVNVLLLFAVVLMLMLDRPQTNNRSHVVRVRNKLRGLSTLGYRKRIAALCGMWIAYGISALLATCERN